MAYYIYKRGYNTGTEVGARGSLPHEDPIVRTQGPLVDLEKEGLPLSVTNEREQTGRVETALRNVEYGTASSGYVQAHHGGDIVETIPPVNADLASGRLRYPDGDERQ